jgi:site-specific DNA-methyltransferase (adenine-specific)
MNGFGRRTRARGTLNSKKAPLRYHEAVLVFSLNGATYNPQMTEGHKPGNFARRTKFTPNYGAQRESEPYGGATQRYPRSVQHFDILNNDDSNRVHPTQKPVPLMEYLIRTYSNEGETILDFAMGSGTTGEAALRCGRKFIGIELSSEYVKLAEARLTKVQ